MKAWIALLFFIASISTSGAPSAQDFEAKGILMPYFNEAGYLSYRLTAEQGSYGQGNPRVSKVVIEVYSGDEDKTELGRIIADEAELIELGETIVGEGRARYVTEAFYVSGYDFVIDLKAETLLLKRDCSASNLEYELSSRSMFVEYDANKQIQNDGFYGIRRLTAKEDVEILSKAVEEKEFDAAYTEIALYDGNTGFIHLPKKIQVFRGEQKVYLDHLKIKTTKSGLDGLIYVPSEH